MRKIPVPLQNHLQQPVTTTCRLLKLTLTDGREVGLATLDRDVVYDGVTYSAINGFDASVIATDASFGIDNAEGYALLSGTLSGITAEMVKRGDLDDATWECRLVNYEDLDAGHLMLDAGDIGEVRVVRDTVFIPELVSYAMRLRNALGGVDSRTCRATFGLRADTQLGCGVDTAPLWRNGTVDGIGAEDRRVFADSALDPGPHPLAPGRLQWQSGDNVSQRHYQIERHADGTFELMEPLPFPVQAGDTFRVRPDCDKTFESCRDRWDNMLNFKGEPFIPINDGTAAQTPGVTV